MRAGLHHLRAGLFMLIVSWLVCLIAAGAFAAAAEAAPSIVVDISAQREVVSGDGFTAQSTVTVSVYAAPGGALLATDQVGTDAEGYFSLEEWEAHHLDLTAGMQVRATDDSAVTTKSLTLADITFDELDVVGDTAAGTAPPGAQVSVLVYAEDWSVDHELAVVADGSTGVWTADYGGDGFDITWRMEGYATVLDGDGDGTRVTGVTGPRFSVEPGSGDSGGIGGDFFTPASSVDISIHAAGGADELFSATVSTDERTGSFWLGAGDLGGVTLAPGMVVEVSDAASSKSLTLAALTFDGLDIATDTATGSGPPGAEVVVEVSDESSGTSKTVTVSGGGAWSADLAPFDVLPGANGTVRYYDGDGDFTRDSWWWPRIQASRNPFGWSDRVAGGPFTADSSVGVSVYESAAPGMPVWSGSVPTDGAGGFQTELDGLALEPGMRVVATDPIMLLSKSLIVADLWVDVFDPDGDVVSGIGPAGGQITLVATGETGEDLGSWTVDVAGAGTWSLDLGALSEPVDVTWTCGGEVWTTDADGDQTMAEAHPRQIAGDLAGDLIKGTFFSCGEEVAVEVRGAAGGAVLWSGSVATDARGLLSVPRAVHGIDLAGGMVVNVVDGEVALAKSLTLTPLTFDELDMATDMARGTGQPGVFIHVWAMVPDGGGEVGYPVPDAFGRWSLDFAALGWDVTPEVSAGANVYDGEMDATEAPFIPYVTALRSSTHPDPEAWYAGRDPAFAWTPSPSTAGYSWVLDQSPATVPDTSIDGASPSCAYSGVADGVWYFHVRAVGGPGIRDGGPLYAGAASHLQVRIDTAAPAIAAVTSLTHGSGGAWSTNNDPVFEWTVAATGRVLDPGPALDGRLPDGAATSERIGARAADVSGFSWTLDHAAATVPDESVDGTAARAGFTDVADGVWYLHVRARDAAGNWGAAQHAAVRIDAGRPTPRAYAATVRSGRRVSVRYRLSDGAAGCGSGSVKIVIRNARGKVMKTKTVKGLAINTRKAWTFTCRWPAGRYTIRITGSDLAGNKGTRAATAVLRVR